MSKGTYLFISVDEEEEEDGEVLDDEVTVGAIATELRRREAIIKNLKNIDGKDC